MSVVALIDYGSGNLRSAAKALERVADSQTRVLVTADPAGVAGADRIVLPGVGAFADCMGGLSAVHGMVAALYEAVIIRGRPFLGICVGMQLMARVGHEHGSHSGLGWMEVDVGPLQPDNPDLKIPHMGWNQLRVRAPDHPVLAGIGDGKHVYFVHSYAMKPDHPQLVLADCDYGGYFPAIVGRDNLVGTQFHPEKSQATGLSLIENFLRWTP